MSDVYLIEVDGQAVGLVARDGARTFRFHAAVPEVFCLDGGLFRTPLDAQKAARKALKRPTTPPGPKLDRAA